MVAAFLAAEIESPHYRQQVRDGLARFGRGRAIVDTPNLTDVAANAIRAALLDYRGYQRRVALFQGFPRDVTWHRAVLDRAAFEAIKYLNITPWPELSDGTRLVKEGAKNVANKRPTSMREHFDALTKRFDAGEKLPELILAAPSEDSPLVLLEGHARATAFLLSTLVEINAIIGYSPGVRSWVFY